jgi:hypothetical protein
MLFGLLPLERFGALVDTFEPEVETLVYLQLVIAKLDKDDLLATIVGARFTEDLGAPLATHGVYGEMVIFTNEGAPV